MEAAQDLRACGGSSEIRSSVSSPGFFSFDP